MTLRAPGLPRALLSLLVTLATLCAACGAPGVVPWPDGAVVGDSRADAPADAPAPDSPADTVAPPPDAPADAADDQVGPDVAGDGAPPLDGPGDAAADGSRDASAETGTDAHAESSADVSDAPADPLLDQVTALRVTARAADYTWTMPVSQSCSITGGTLSIGAEFRGAEPLTVTASGPVSGPVVLTVVGAGSDVRATVTRGAEYAAGGMNRANVRVRGMLPTELVIEVTALGCVVR